VSRLRNVENSGAGRNGIYHLGLDMTVNFATGVSNGGGASAMVCGRNQLKKKMSPTRRSRRGKQSDYRQ
jgi:hypothetical protein